MDHLPGMPTTPIRGSPPERLSDDRRVGVAAVGGGSGLAGQHLFDQVAPAQEHPPRQRLVEDEAGRGGEGAGQSQRQTQLESLVALLPGELAGEAVEAPGQLRDPPAQGHVEDLQPIVGDHEDGDVLHVVHVTGAVQVDEVDAILLRVVDDVVDVEVAVDVDREGCLETFFEDLGASQQRVETGHRHATDAAVAAGEFAVDGVDLRQALRGLPHERGVHRLVGSGLAPDRAQGLAQALQRPGQQIRRFVQQNLLEGVAGEVLDEQCR